MCGIVGVFPLNKLNLQIDAATRRIVTLFLHNEILYETIVRGKDATGLAVSFGYPYNTEGDISLPKFWSVIKQPVDAIDFFLNDGTQLRYKGQDEEANINRVMDVACLLERPLLHVLGHTRAKTTGSEYMPNNNHPILVGNIIGIHNGGIRNYKKIYDKHKKMTPQGEVDSEVIVQLLAEQANDRALEIEDIKYVTERIDGPHAVLAYNRCFPEKVLYFHDRERPLELAYIEELGLALICSKKDFLEKALHVYSRARLTLKRDLPELSCEWRNIPDEMGGVIDIETEIDDTQRVEEMFPLVKTADVLTDYRQHTSTIKKSHQQHSGAYGGNNGVGFQGNKTSTDQTPSENVIPEAELIDITGYSADIDDDGKVESVVASVDDVMDDTDEVTADMSDLLDTEDLRRQGTEFAFGERAKGDETLLINRSEGEFKKLFTVAGISEGDAAESIHQLYPEIFGEGYAEGYRESIEVMEAVQDDEESLSEQVTGLEDEISGLQDKLVQETGRLHKAAAIIANMKAFLIAAIITNRVGEVEESEGGANLIFSENLEDFLCTAEGFHKVSSSVVRELFSKKDLQTISGNMLQLSHQVNEEHEAAQQRTTKTKS